LDQNSVAAVEKLLGQALSEGVAMLWVTHDPQQVKRLAKRRLQVKDGNVREIAL
jgi:ABC-type iron transport system FetAB ATPase subunit